MEDHELRDWFAGQALSNIAGSEHMHYVFLKMQEDGMGEAPRLAAEYCYQMADAMMFVKKALQSKERSAH